MSKNMPDPPDIITNALARSTLVSALEVLHACKKRVETTHGKAGNLWQECYHAVEAIENLLGDDLSEDGECGHCGLPVEPRNNEESCECDDKEREHDE